MIRICICDDESVHVRHTKKIIAKHMAQRDNEIETFSSAEALLKQIQENSYFPDIAVLDIELKGMNGIDLTGRLNTLCPGCSIIFLTGHVDYCSDVYDTEHIYFLLKEKADRLLPTALDKALASIEKQKETFIPLNIHGSTVTFPPDRILYIESDLRKLIIHTREGSLETYGKLDDFDLESRGLPFVRCHKSYLVNLKFISGISGSHFVLITGETVPVSRSRFNASKERFLKYLSADRPLTVRASDGQNIADRLRLGDDSPRP